MSFKEWNAVVMFTGGVVIGGWVAWQAAGANAPQSAPEVATMLLWAVFYGVAFNVAAIVILSVVMSAARREAFVDEAADERDRSVDIRATRNAYLILSVSGVAILIGTAMGMSPAHGTYALFGALLLAGTVHALSLFVYYRIG